MVYIVYIMLSFDQGTSEFNFRNSDVARILQPDRKENSVWAYGFGFITCFFCNIPAGCLALLFANQV